MIKLLDRATGEETFLADFSQNRYLISTGRRGQEQLPLFITYSACDFLKRFQVLELHSKIEMNTQQEYDTWIDRYGHEVEYTSEEYDSKLKCKIYIFRTIKGLEKSFYIPWRNLN